MTPDFDPNNYLIADEYLNHCRRFTEASPRSALATRLLRAAIRLKEHQSC